MTTTSEDTTEHDPSRREPSPHDHRAEVIDTAISWIEDGLYVVIAAVLSLCAIALAVVVARGVPGMFSGGSQDAVLGILDVVLLVFIVTELLFAVRETVVRRELVAEPFLLVGVIASIKEIVVLSVKAAESAGTGAEFRDNLALIGVLGLLVLLLAISALLLRRKEREPDEGREEDAQPKAQPKAQPEARPETDPQEA